MKLEAIVEKAEQEYKNTVTEQVHDFMERNKAYYPDGLRLYSSRLHSHCYLHIYNEDGKRVHRTFIEQSNGYQYKPLLTYKLQEDSLEAMHYFGRCIKDMGEAIDNFEDAEGGDMFEFDGLHFKGTHTMHDLGLDVVPEYVITEMVKFGWAPQHYHVAGLWYDCKQIREEWNCKTFRKASGTEYDVFLCMEDGQYYFPAKSHLSNVCMSNLEKNIKFWIREHEEIEAA